MFTHLSNYFQAVLQERQNGPIKRYHIRYWLLSNMSYPLGEEVIDSLDLRVNISGLDPWRWYAVEVFAENEGGEGTHSNYVTVRTLPAGTYSNKVNKKRRWNIYVLIASASSRCLDELAHMCSLARAFTSRKH